MSYEAIKDAYAIINAIAGLAGDESTIQSFIDGLSGSSSTLNTLLEDLNNNVITGFQDVVDAINDAALTDAWQPINQSLTYIGTSLMAYQAAMATVAGPAGGPYTITYNSDAINFIDWCNGYTDSGGTVHRSHLDEMSSWVNVAPLANSYLSLAGIFSSVPPAPGALKLLVEIAQAAQGDPTGVQASMAYDTQYNSVLKFMDAINKLVTLTYYVHDSALALRNQILGKKVGAQGRQPLTAAIAANFGNVSASGTIWNQFAATLSQLATATPQTQVSAFKPHMFPPTHAVSTWERQPSNGWVFLPHKVQISDFYSNAYFSAIGLVHVESSQYPEYPYSDGWVYQNAHAALVGTAVQVGPVPAGGTAPTFTPLPAVPDVQGVYGNSGNWVASPETGADGSTYNLVTYAGALQLGTCEPSYVVPPAVTSNNHVRVVTGFQFVALQNGQAFNVGVALQFGELDMSDPANPTVTVADDSFIPPNLTEQPDVQQFINTNLVGDYSTGSNGHGVVTSVSMQQYQGGNGPTCLGVQMIPTFYMADFYQPTNLPVIVAPPPAS